MELGWQFVIMDLDAYLPFNQFYYRTDLIVNLFYSNNSNIDSYDISYIENGIPKNEIVTKSELKPITLTEKILKEILGAPILGSNNEFVIRFERIENNGYKYNIRIEPNSEGNWKVSVNGKNCQTVKYLHNLQNYIRHNTADNHRGHTLLYVANNQNQIII